MVKQGSRGGGPSPTDTSRSGQGLVHSSGHMPLPLTHRTPAYLVAAAQRAPTPPRVIPQSLIIPSILPCQVGLSRSLRHSPERERRHMGWVHGRVCRIEGDITRPWRDRSAALERWCLQVLLRHIMTLLLALRQQRSVCRCVGDGSKSMGRSSHQCGSCVQKKREIV